MIIYDIVILVRPEHKGSYPPGRWWGDVRDRREDAEAYAKRCNECRMASTLEYVVEEHDELSPERAPLMNEHK